MVCMITVLEKNKTQSSLFFEELLSFVILSSFIICGGEVGGFQIFL